MLKLTDDAATMISTLVEALPDGAGLRIAPREDHAALAMSLATAADPDDVIVLDHDVRVFLAPVADVRLAGSTLDARRNEAGSAFFVRP